MGREKEGNVTAIQKWAKKKKKTNKTPLKNREGVIGSSDS